MFLVTKVFTTGLLKGIEITERTTVKFHVGVMYKPCAGSSAYVVTACVKTE